MGGTVNTVGSLSIDNTGGTVKTVGRLKIDYSGKHF